MQLSFWGKKDKSSKGKPSKQRLLEETKELVEKTERLTALQKLKQVEAKLQQEISAIGAELARRKTQVRDLDFQLSFASEVSCAVPAPEVILPASSDEYSSESEEGERRYSSPSRQGPVSPTLIKRSDTSSSTSSSEQSPERRDSNPSTTNTAGEVDALSKSGSGPVFVSQGLNIQPFSGRRVLAPLKNPPVLKPVEQTLTPEEQKRIECARLNRLVPLKRP